MIRFKFLYYQLPPCHIARMSMFIIANSEHEACTKFAESPAHVYVYYSRGIEVQPQ